MINEYEKKKLTIELLVTPLAMAVNDRLKSLEYSAPVRAGRIQGEYITLQFNGGGVKKLDVTATSIAYIAIAVLRAVA